MEFKYFSRNGKLAPIEEAVVPLSNIEYQYGFGVYETIRVKEGVPFFLKDHLERLQESARIIGLTHTFTQAGIEKSIADLIKKSGKDTYNLKLLLIGGTNPTLSIVPLNPRFSDKKLYRDGAHFITVEYERAFLQAKTLNMLQSYLAYQKAREADAYDALLINNKGCITEGTRTNFFCIQGRTLISPPENDILPGIMRKAVLQVAKAEGFEFEEKDMRFSDIVASDGAFITSTSSKILPVRSIDSQEFSGVPDNLQDLMDSFDTFLDKCKGRL